MAAETIYSCDDIPALLPLETIGVKMYVRPLLIFQLQHDYDISHLKEVIKGAFEATKRRIPVLDCKIVPDSQATQKGVAKLEKMEATEIPTVVFKNLRSSDDREWSFNDLKAQHFPSIGLDGELLTPMPPAPSPGSLVPVAALQVNFIRGGMIMCLATHHIPGDARTFLEWTKIFAEECRRAQGIDISANSGFNVAMLNDRERLRERTATKKVLGDIKNHPEYFILPSVPEGNGGGMIPDINIGRVYSLSPESLKELKTDASPSNATDSVSDVPWISTSDALAALLWRTCVRAQSSLDRLEGDPSSFMSFPIDNRGRTALDPPAHPRTLGNFFSIADASMSARKVLTTANLADLAAPIRRSVRSKDGRHYDSLASVILSLDHVETLVPTLLNSLACSVMTTTWVDLDYYNVGWGPLFGDYIESVRFPGRGIMNGILPRLPNGGIEVYLSMSPDSHKALEVDPVWNKYTQLRG